MRFDDAKEELLRCMQERLKEAKRIKEILEERLKGLSPKDILKRGYSIVINEKGDVISSAKSVKTHEKLKIETYNGAFNAKVIDE